MQYNSPTFSGGLFVEAGYEHCGSMRLLIYGRLRGKPWPYPCKIPQREANHESN